MYNCNGSLIHILDVDEFNLHSGVADLFFFTWPAYADSWSELFVLTYDRTLRRYLVPFSAAFPVEERGYDQSLRQYHSFVTTMAFSPTTRIVAVGGGLGPDGTFSVLMNSEFWLRI